MQPRKKDGTFAKGGHAPTYKGGRIMREGYWYIHRPKHPLSQKQGYIAEHRIVMEEKIGRILEPQEAVHHIDHDRTNNHPDNLELYATHGQHTKQAHPELFERQKIDFSGKHFSPKTEFRKGMTPWNKGMKRIAPGKWI